MNPGETSGSGGRRSERVSLRIPIEVKGKDSGGREFTEKTFTLIINRDGARICSWQMLVPESQITIANLKTGVSCTFRVVGPAGKSLGEGPEWGVECLEPDRGIWGIYFPSQSEAAASEADVDALIECRACKGREFSKLSLDEFGVLGQEGSIRRRCKQCGTDTEWQFAFVEEEEEAIPRQSAEDAERRRARRLRVKLPVRIRLEDGRVQVARTENLSRTGACFVADVEIQQNELIWLIVGYDESESQQTEVAARVVWRKLLEGTSRFAYGVQLEPNA